MPLVKMLGVSCVSMSLVGVRQRKENPMKQSEKYPCWCCYNRKPGCHTTCEQYIAHRKTVKAKSDAVRVERDATIMQDRYEKEKFKRIK